MIWSFVHLTLIMLQRCSVKVRSRSLVFYNSEFIPFRTPTYLNFAPGLCFCYRQVSFFVFVYKNHTLHERLNRISVNIASSVCVMQASWVVANIRTTHTHTRMLTSCWSPAMDEKPMTSRAPGDSARTSQTPLGTVKVSSRCRPRRFYSYIYFTKVQELAACRIWKHRVSRSVVFLEI